MAECVIPGCPWDAKYTDGKCNSCHYDDCIVEGCKGHGNGPDGKCSTHQRGQCVEDGCVRQASRINGPCKNHMYGPCIVCGVRADGPDGLCALHYTNGPEYVASQGWSANDPGIVYLAEWPNFVKVGIGIDQRRADLWVKHGAVLYAVVDMGSRANALSVETPMKYVFLPRIGERAFMSEEVAPRYLKARTGWTECWVIDSLYLDAVRGEFDRLTRPAWGDPL